MIAMISYEINIEKLEEFTKNQELYDLYKMTM